MRLERLRRQAPLRRLIQWPQLERRHPNRAPLDDQSYERQERDLRAFAKRAGHKVVAVFKETGSGADNGRPERAKVLALARAHKIDAILVTELGRWGHSTQDLVQTLDDLHGWKVSVLAQTGLSSGAAQAEQTARGYEGRDRYCGDCG